MAIEKLCSAIVADRRQECLSIIWKLGPHNFDGIDPTLQLRPIDLAARYCRVEILESLMKYGAELVRPLALQTSAQNVIVAVLSNFPFDPFHWLSFTAYKDWLAAEGISEEHFRAGTGHLKRDTDDLEKEDNDGLLPVHYAILAGNESFQSWIPERLKADFLHSKIQKNGLYHQISAAWFFASSHESIALLSQYSIDCLNSIDLSVTLNAELDVAQSVFFRFLRNSNGKEFLSKLPSFKTLDWNTTEQGIAAAWELCTMNDYGIKLLFQLPTDTLAKLEWNRAPTEDSYPLCFRQGHLSDEQLKYVTLAALVAKHDSGQQLLSDLPADLINQKIDWAATTNTSEDAAKYRAINWFAPSSWERLSPAFRKLLDKMNVNTLSQLVNVLSVKDMAYKYVVVTLIEDLLVWISIDKNLKTFSDEQIRTQLNQFAQLFKELETYLTTCPTTIAMVNGLKGQIIFLMATCKRTANLLLQMPDPFFRQPIVFNMINDACLRVKAIAMTYELRGKEADVMDGSLQSYSIFKAMDGPKEPSRPRLRYNSCG